MTAITAYSEELRQFIKQIDSGSISENYLCELVKLSRGIIQAHLTFFRSSVTPLCLQQGITITDLAYDCIAEAFGKDSDNRFYKFHNFIESVEPDLDTITYHGLFLAYKAFLVRFADAQIARLYSQMDPSGSHIHRNIRECLKGSKYFILKKDFRGFVLVPLELDTLEHLGPFPQDRLAGVFLSEISSRDPIPKILGTLHRILAEQSEFRRTVPLIELVWLVKGLFNSDFNPELLTDHPWSTEGFNEEELRQLRADVENAIKEKILLTYLVRGKINDKQARGMFNAISDILGEWFAGNGSPDSLSFNLNHHLSVDPETYEQDFRPKMEYLLKLARQEISGRLMSEL